MKQQFRIGIADTIRLTIYQSNRALIPTSAKITLYKPSGSELQAQADASVDATTGEMTYALTATHTADNDENYKAVWEYIYNGTTYYETQLFDVVLSILSIPITDDDIYDELESLRKVNMQATALATAGAAGTLTDTKRREADDYWKGGTIDIIAGTGIGQKRDITGFTQSTGVFDITPDWATNPDTTSMYLAVKSFSNKIQQSFKKLETMLYDKGKRCDLILESSQIEVPLLYLTIHFICLDLMDEIDDKWERLAKNYWEKFQNAFNNMKLDYDEDESGSIDESEAQQSQTSLRISRA
ncbi:MAG: hypothetical protein PHY56_05400 [Candidatus Omnitrophica bacterium]|nr:hypothetical protein [Candidatus Omnitrophota bacterium]